MSDSSFSELTTKDQIIRTWNSIQKKEYETWYAQFVNLDKLVKNSELIVLDDEDPSECSEDIYLILSYGMLSPHKRRLAVQHSKIIKKYDDHCNL